jgi:hypothetical protein
MGKRGQKPAVAIEVLIEEYRSGMTGIELGRKYDVSYQSIYQRLYNAGIVPRLHIHRCGNHRPRKEQPARGLATQRKVSDEDLLSSYNQFQNVKAVAEFHNIAYTNAYRHLKNLGVVKGYGYKRRKSK